MTSGLFKILTILSVTIMVTGCKIAVIVGEGGNVTSSSGTRDCASTKYCINEITDANYTETFTVTDNPGFQFVRWQGGTDFQCGGSTSRTCTVKTNGMTQYGTYYLMPIFLDVGFDTDGDGQFDRADADDDNDGVLDVDDNCDLEGPNLDGYGCPVVPDTDGDGVPNATDQCPATSTGATVFPNGCVLDVTLDTDGDGVPDVFDWVRISYNFGLYQDMYDGSYDNDLGDLSGNVPLGPHPGQTMLDAGLCAYYQQLAYCPRLPPPVF